MFIFASATAHHLHRLHPRHRRWLHDLWSPMAVACSLPPDLEEEIEDDVADVVEHEQVLGLQVGQALGSGQAAGAHLWGGAVAVMKGATESTRKGGTRWGMSQAS